MLRMQSPRAEPAPRTPRSTQTTQPGRGTRSAPARSKKPKLPERRRAQRRGWCGGGRADPIPSRPDWALHRCSSGDCMATESRCHLRRVRRGRAAAARTGDTGEPLLRDASFHGRAPQLAGAPEVVSPVCVVENLVSRPEERGDVSDEHRIYVAMRRGRGVASDPARGSGASTSGGRVLSQQAP